MKLSRISTSPIFEGKIIVKNKISNNQKYLFNLHKQTLENMIKDMPFDLFVEQSKSKKTITLSTNVENASSYIVRKNKQNFEEVASYAISDGKQKSKIYQDMTKAQNMLDASRAAFISVIFGNFKQAREQEKELAKTAIKDFDVYKQIPQIKLQNVPFFILQKAFVNGLKYRVYKAFSSKIPEEKQFYNMKKEYFNQLKSENKKPKTVTLTIPNIY